MIWDGRPNGERLFATERNPTEIKQALRVATDFTDHNFKLQLKTPTI